MHMHVLMILLCGVVIIPLTTAQDCAQCPSDQPQTPDQNKYCQNDFALRVFIRTRSIKGNSVSYKFLVLETFKMKKSIPKKKRKSLVTTNDACGVTLNPGEEYIVSGNADSSNTLTLNKCTSIVRTIRDVLCGKDSTEPTELSNFKGGYGANCGKCQVVTCQNLDECPTSKDTCPVEFLEYDCPGRKYSLCQFDATAGQCQWKTNPTITPGLCGRGFFYTTNWG